MTSQDSALLDRIRDTLREVEPDAQVILYGSRARGDAQPDSDWDLLILLDGSVDAQRTAAVQRRLYQVELETDTVLSSIVHSKEDWASPLYRAMPFYESVMTEGIDLGESTGTFLSRDDPPGRYVAWGEKTMTPERQALVRYRMERAQEALAAANLLADSGLWNACVNRLYYACFYAVSALLLQHGLSSTKHSGVRSLFNRRFVKAGVVAGELGMLYNELFENRNKGDYEDLVWFEEGRVRPWLSQARQFVAAIQDLLELPAEEPPGA